MIVDNNPIAPGAWPVTLEDNFINYFQEALSEPRQNQILFCKSISAMLNLDYVDHVIYDYKYVISEGNITAGPSLWHTDGLGKFDCQLMTYMVSPELTVNTGMRVGFKNLLANTESYLNLRSGSCFLARQDRPEYQHRVEPKIGSVDRRICFTICLNGIERLGLDLS